MNTTVADCEIVSLRKINSSSGNLVVIQGRQDIPFDIKRIYYINDVPEKGDRGSHAHKNLTQFIVATEGVFTLVLDDGKSKRNILLSKEGDCWGVLIKPGIWRILEGFSKGAVCLVLASADYDENDYIRNYDEFLKFKL
jgi:hypothetical protein